MTKIDKSTHHKVIRHIMRLTSSLEKMPCCFPQPFLVRYVISCRVMLFLMGVIWFCRSVCLSAALALTLFSLVLRTVRWDIFSE